MRFGVAIIVACIFCVQSLNGQVVAEEDPRKMQIAEARERATEIVDGLMAGVQPGVPLKLRKKFAAAVVLPRHADGIQLATIQGILRECRRIRENDKLLWGEMLKYLEESSTVPHLAPKFEDYVSPKRFNRN